jgi:hypothetical protein
MLMMSVSLIIVDGAARPPIYQIETIEPRKRQTALLVAAGQATFDDKRTQE